MALTKWKNPSTGLQRSSLLTPSFNDFFSDFFSNDLVSREFAGFVPSVNIIENGESYNIEVAAPGFDKQDFAVNVENGVLTIQAQHEEEENEKSTDFVRREFTYGSFKRSFNLVNLIDETKIDAAYENGILRVELAKSERMKAKSPRQIKIS
jgi:HSP20 family protein